MSDRSGGRVSFTCSDGQSAGVDFFLMGRRQSTGVGLGLTDQRRSIEGWSGPALREVFERENGTTRYTCGAHSVELL